MSPDQIFIIDRPMPLVPYDNPVTRQALKNVLDKGKNLLPGFSPLYAQGSLNITIKRYFTDSSGFTVDKSTVPAALQKDYPVYLLGNFDRIGGYNIGQKTVKQPAGVFYVMTYVNNYSNSFLSSTGFLDVSNNFKIGDIITVFTDDLANPNYFVFIQQTCQYGSLASIISNTQTQQQDGVIGQLFVKNIGFQVDQENQISQSWQMVALDNLGQFKSQPFDPITFKKPLYRLNDFIELPISFLMTQFTAINFLMNFTCNEINVNFRISK